MAPRRAHPQAARTGAARRDTRAEWRVTIALGLAMLLVPVGFLVLLSGDGRDGLAEPASASSQQAARSVTDRAARVTFHLRPGSLGMRILRGAPRDTRLVRGRRVRVLCGSVSGLTVYAGRWRRGADTLELDVPPDAYARTEFCALKRGSRGVARVVFP